MILSFAGSIFVSSRYSMSSLSGRCRTFSLALLQTLKLQSVKLQAFTRALTLKISNLLTLSNARYLELSNLKLRIPSNIRARKLAPPLCLLLCAYGTSESLKKVSTFRMPPASNAFKLQTFKLRLCHCSKFHWTKLSKIQKWKNCTCDTYKIFLGRGLLDSVDEQAVALTWPTS